jgi:hypothetical protein
VVAQVCPPRLGRRMTGPQADRVQNHPRVRQSRLPMRSNGTRLSWRPLLDGATGRSCRCPPTCAAQNTLRAAVSCMRRLAISCFGTGPPSGRTWREKGLTASDALAREGMTGLGRLTFTQVLRQAKQPAKISIRRATPGGTISDVN